MDWKTRYWGIGFLLLGSACSESIQPTVPSQTHIEPGNITLSVPVEVASARAINLDALFADVVITDSSGTSQQQFNQSTPISLPIDVQLGDMLSITVNWFERQTDSTPLALATWTLNQEITGDTTITVDSADFITSGDGFDFDGDTYSNLEELRADSDPMVAGITPENRPDVTIPWVNPTEAPIIDGLYDSIWNNAQFTDADGEQLFIDNLMINQGAVRPDGTTEFRWFAMHDDTSLYIFVLGETVSISTPIRDSTSVWQDDNLNIYIDGNNSKLESYDGVDDRHLLIPLLTSPNDPSSNGTVFVTGSNSATLPDFEFFTCLCSDGQHTWEIKLPLAELNISKDVPFGIDIQIDEDNDGGARDAKWGWFHPSRTTVDVDNTFTTPSFMGTAVID